MSGPSCGCGERGPAHLAPGGSGLAESLAAYGDALIALFNTDPVRGIALVVGGAPGAIVTAFVENRGNVSASTKQAACDLSLVYAAAAVIVPSVATLALGPVGLVVGGTYGALCALIAAICSYLCNGTPIPGSVVVNAAASSAALSGHPLSSSDVAALSAAIPSGGSSVATTAPLSIDDQALMVGVTTFLHLAATPSVPVATVKSASLQAAKAVRNATWVTTHLSPLFVDWDRAKNPRTFEACVVIARHRFLQAWMTTAVSQAAAALGQPIPAQLIVRTNPIGVAPIDSRLPGTANLGGELVAQPGTTPTKTGGGLALPAVAAAVLYALVR